MRSRSANHSTATFSNATLTVIIDFYSQIQSFDAPVIGDIQILNYGYENYNVFPSFSEYIRDKVL
jgi:hypothetical protein